MYTNLQFHVVVDSTSKLHELFLPEHVIVHATVLEIGIEKTQ